MQGSQGNKRRCWGNLRGIPVISSVREDRGHFTDVSTDPDRSCQVRSSASGDGYGVPAGTRSARGSFLMSSTRYGVPGTVIIKGRLEEKSQLRKTKAKCA
jgi:hypothetical protein